MEPPLILIISHSFTQVKEEFNRVQELMEGKRQKILLTRQGARRRVRSQFRTFGAGCSSVPVDVNSIIRHGITRQAVFNMAICATRRYATAQSGQGSKKDCPRTGYVPRR